MDVIKIPHRITREFVQAHPQWIFVYSHDVSGKSFFGQSFSCHGEPNAFPVPVMWKACKSSGYFQESQALEINKLIDKAIEAIPKDGRPIIPLPKIGKGYSRMEEFCLTGFNYLKARLHIIAYPNIEIKYGTI